MDERAKRILKAYTDIVDAPKKGELTRDGKEPTVPALCNRTGLNDISAAERDAAGEAWAEAESAGVRVAGEAEPGDEDDGDPDAAQAAGAAEPVMHTREKIRRAVALRQAMIAELEEGTRLDEGGQPTLEALETRCGFLPEPEEAFAAYNAAVRELKSGIVEEPLPARPGSRSHVPQPRRAGPKMVGIEIDKNTKQPTIVQRQRRQFPWVMYHPEPPPGRPVTVTVRGALEFEREYARGYRALQQLTPEQREQAVAAANRASGAA